MSSTKLTRYRPQYVAKKALFHFLGNAFRLYDPEGNLAFFVKQKAFKIKEELTVFADEGQTEAMLFIHARSVIDFSAAYDVTDAKSGEKVGALRREGMKSMIRDEWTLFDSADTPIGAATEDSGLMAIIRRLFIPIIPQTFRVTIGDAEVGIVKQTFNPFQLGYLVDFSEAAEKLDPRMTVATVVLLLAIEGRQG